MSSSPSTSPSSSSHLLRDALISIYSFLTLDSFADALAVSRQWNTAGDSALSRKEKWRLITTDESMVEAFFRWKLRRHITALTIRNFDKDQQDDDDEEPASTQLVKQIAEDEHLQRIETLDVVIDYTASDSYLFPSRVTKLRVYMKTPWERYGPPQDIWTQLPRRFSEVAASAPRLTHLSFRIQSNACSDPCWNEVPPPPIAVFLPLLDCRALNVVELQDFGDIWFQMEGREAEEEEVEEDSDMTPSESHQAVGQAEPPPKSVIEILHRMKNVTHYNLGELFPDLLVALARTSDSAPIAAYASSSHSRVEELRTIGNLNSKCTGALKKFTNLTALRPKTFGVEEPTVFLQEFPRLRVLHAICQENVLGSSILTAIQGLSQLQELAIAYTGMSDENLVTLLTPLVQLRKLKVGSTLIDPTPYGVWDCIFLKAVPKLQHLTLTQLKLSQFKVDQMQVVADTLESLTVLSCFHGGGLNEEGLQNLTSMLKKVKTIQFDENEM